MQCTNSEGIRVRPPESLPSLRNQRSASQPEVFPCCASTMMSASLVRRNYGPQLNELMAAARKRLNQLRLIVTPRTTGVLIASAYRISS